MEEETQEGADPKKKQNREETAVTVSASPSSPVPSVTVASLYRHALESIFAFLPLTGSGGLTSVVRVSSAWSAAVASMRSIQATVRYLPPRRFHESGHSKLARHIGSLDLETALKVTVDNLLQLIAQRMPTSTRCTANLFSLSLSAAVSCSPHPSRLFMSLG